MNWDHLLRFLRLRGRGHRHRFRIVGFYATDDPDEVIALFKCTRCAHEHTKSVARLRCPYPRVSEEEPFAAPSE